MEVVTEVLRTKHDQSSSHSDLYRRLKTDKESGILELDATDQQVTEPDLTAVQVQVEPTTVRVMHLVTVIDARHVVSEIRVVIPAGLVVNVRFTRDHQPRSDHHHRVVGSNDAITLFGQVDRVTCGLCTKPNTRYARYTSPTPTRLNCRVESLRWCIFEFQGVIYTTQWVNTATFVRHLPALSAGNPHPLTPISHRGFECYFYSPVVQWYLNITLTITMHNKT